MPELPDVELARRDLHRWLRGAEIRAARATDAYITRGSSSFNRGLAGSAVKEVRRRGKWLCVDLEDGARIFSHLGMTGRWVRVDDDAPVQRFERARFSIVRRGRASSVRYLDSRRFGRLLLAREDIAEWADLGPDPLADGIDPSHLAGALKNRRGPIKDALMDQSVLAGVGNIMVTEALWHARLDPRSPAGALSKKDIGAVARELTKEIERELRDKERERPTREREGNFIIYGHAGEPCPRCGTKLARIVLAGRGTVFCTGCQKRLQSSSIGPKSSPERTKNASP